MLELIAGQQQLFNVHKYVKTKKDKAHLNTTQTINEFPHGSYVLVLRKIQLKPLKRENLS